MDAGVDNWSEKPSADRSSGHGPFEERHLEGALVLLWGVIGPPVSFVRAILRRMKSFRYG